MSDPTSLSDSGEGPDLYTRTWSLLRTLEGRPAAEVAAELTRSLPESSRLEHWNDYRGPWSQENRVGYYLNDVNIGREVYEEMAAIVRDRGRRECAAEGHLLHSRRCRCGEVHEPARRGPA